MMHEQERRIKDALVGVLSDGFNRSLGALVSAGAVDTSEMNKEYRGVGSKYYDLVTEQLELTAKNAVQSVLELLEETSDDAGKVRAAGEVHGEAES